MTTSREDLDARLLDAQHELALLIEAINQHQRACERQVSKAAWGRANGELYRARLAIERGHPLTIEELQERVGWTIDQTADRLEISVEDVVQMLRTGALERVEVTGLVTEASIRRLEARCGSASDPADQGSRRGEGEDAGEGEAGE